MKEKFFDDLGVSLPPVLDVKVQKVVSNLLSTRLTPTEQLIVSLSYGIETEPKNYKEIGDTVALHATKVRRIKEKAIRKICWPTVRASLMLSIENQITEHRFIEA